jgi:menaquinone-9 beta-reductase
MNNYDFKIYGAGPIGSYCAAKLAKQGYKVKLVDKAQFPRDKLCGGGLTLKSTMRIKALHTGFDQDGIVDYVENFEIMNPSSHATIPFKWIPKWLGIVKRNIFDQWMLNKAIESGVEFSNESHDSIKSFLADEAKFVIGADGATSTIGQICHGQFKNDDTVVATEAYVFNKDGNKFASVITNPTHDPYNAGYSWLFARGERIGIGTAVYRSYDYQLNNFRVMISNISKNEYGHEVDLKLYRNWIIPLYRERNANYGQYLACIGDALGVADAFFAEGLAAGFISADVLIDSFKHHGDFSYLTFDIQHSEYFSQMKYIKFLQEQSNADYQLAWKLLSQPGVVEGFMKMLNWQQTPKQLVRWVQFNYPRLAIKLAYKAWQNRDNDKPVN